MHTVRVLRSAEAQVRLLALATTSNSAGPSTSALPFSHTPFTTCMLSEGTLALLSGCRFLLQGRELTVARDQIRMTIGCLRQLGELWPRSARNVQEIQMIARHVLGLGPKAASRSVNCKSGSSSSNSSSVGLSANDTAAATSVTSLSAGDDGNSSVLSSAEVDNLYSDEGLDTVCGWYNWDLGTDYSWLLTPEA